MGCNYPVRAYRLHSGEVTFFVKAGWDIREDLLIPCGQCVGCKMDKSKEWAIRCMNEASLYEENCFITLTYNDQNLPDMESLDYRDFQLFMKRLRKHYKGKKIRFYMSGEYGEKGNRPHFHACLFNHNFEDRKILKRTGSGSTLYDSEILNSLWKKGLASIGDVTFESAAYVAKYIMKKVNGKGSELNYAYSDPETGEILYREKEMSKMSLKPGIGSRWFEKWKSDVFPQDHCIVRGKEKKPPKYYYKKLKEQDPDLYEVVKWQRTEKAKKHAKDNTEDRLLVKEKCLEARIKLKRGEL